MGKIAKAAFSLGKSSIGSLIVGLTFGKLSSLLPVKKIIDNKYVVAFWHPKPSHNTHVLIVPKRSIKSLATFDENDEEYIVESLKVAKTLSKALDLENDGYSLIVNGGKKQEVAQLHFHLVSDKKS